MGFLLFTFLYFGLIIASCVSIAAQHMNKFVVTTLAGSPGFCPSSLHGEDEIHAVTESAIQRPLNGGRARHVSAAVLNIWRGCPGSAEKQSQQSCF